MEVAISLRIETPIKTFRPEGPSENWLGAKHVGLPGIRFAIFRDQRSGIQSSVYFMTYKKCLLDYQMSIFFGK